MAANTAQDSGIGAGEASSLEEVTALRADASELWSEAQTKESNLRMSGVQEVSITGFARFFDRIKKRELRMRTASIEKTNISAQSYDRRVLMTTSYDDAVAADVDDLSLSARDLFSDARQEMSNATGRKIDQIILFAMHSIVHEIGDADQTVYGVDGDGLGASRSVSTFLTALTTKYRLNLFHKGIVKRTSTVDNNIKDFSSDDIALIKKVFRKRRVRDEIVAGLLPEVEHQLRVDEKFTNAENIFNPSEQIQSGMYVGFRYRGIRFLPILEDVLPAVNGLYLGANAEGTSRSSSQAAAAAALRSTLVFAKDLSLATTLADYKPEESSTAPVIKLNTAGTAIITDTTTIKNNSIFGGTVIEGNTGTGKKRNVVKQADVESYILHCWVPKSMKFASRSSRMMSKMSDRTDLSHARQYYYRTDFGCLNIDSDYVLGLVTKGEVVRGGAA